MASQVNPRRSTRTSVTRLTKDVESLGLNTNMSLRKAPTFHSPTSSTSSTDDFTPRTLRRSQTTHDDVIDAHKRRAALIVDEVDKTLSSLADSTASSKKKTTKKFRDSSLPVPRSFLDLPVVDPAMAKNTESEGRQLRQRNRRTAQDQPSDSGLGSSLASTKNEKCNMYSSSSKKASTVTRSAATTRGKAQGLSQRALNRIHEFILRPLAEKKSLKDFRSVVNDVSRRMHGGEIICLRDVERTLFFMAPEKAKTPSLYLDFCLTSIRGIRTTVDKLSHERELIRPRDRPYTDLYFMDLTEQIEQYALQLAQAKAQAASGATVKDEMQLDSADEIRLYGGVAKNGQPIQAVRVKKNGKAYSLETGELVDLDEENDFKGPISLKRSLSLHSDDDDEVIERSMARRKKNASPEELAPKKCRVDGCDKEFKRPCDLTKHEKTHSRPWKCPHKTCKYHTEGWPTEKEMQRHINDKHSAAPATFKCLYPPCAYTSKRESNCKQHMEKAHGYKYIRQKTNGKKGHKPTSSSVAANPPQMMTPPTPVSNLGINSPALDNGSPFSASYSTVDFPAYPTPEQFALNYPAHPMELDLDADINLELSPLSNDVDSHLDSLSPYDNTSMTNFTFNDEELYANTMRLPASDAAAFANLVSSAGHMQYQAYSHEDSACQGIAEAPHLSPIGQANAMLYTPKSLVDEGFDDFPSTDDMEKGDFQLFPTTTRLDMQQPLFGEVPSTGIEGLYSQQTQQYNMYNMDWTYAGQ